MSRNERQRNRIGAACLALLGLVLGCDGGGSLAANGGMSGSGISQGPITSFGSIFVNEVEWEVDGAEIEIDGRAGSASELRVGMVVRVQGDLSEDGRSGIARSVVFDDSLEGPIREDPVDLNPEGTRKRLVVLNRNVIVDAELTRFGDGASFDSLAQGQVVEVSGLTDGSGAIFATRIALRGLFPAIPGAELRGRVENLVQDTNGGGIFDLGDVTVRYSLATRFEGGTPGSLQDSDLVEVSGLLRLNGLELDARVIEYEDEGLGIANLQDVELEGFVQRYFSDADFVVSGVVVDASSARLVPPSLVLADGVRVEVEGVLEGGILRASRVQGKGDDAPELDEPRVRIRGAIRDLSLVPRSLDLLGVSVQVGANAVLDDKRDRDPNFRFSDLRPGDFVDLRAIATGPGTARAIRLEREDDRGDVSLRGPVTGLDRAEPLLEVLGLEVPLGPTTRYFDDSGFERSEEEFFRVPGDVSLGDPVEVSDEDADDPTLLEEADEVEIDLD